MDLTFKQVFKLPLLSLKVCRAHPDSRIDLKFFLVFFVFHGIYYIYFSLMLSNIILYNLKENDFVQTCKNGSVIVVKLTGSFQFFVLLRKKKVVKNLFNNIINDYTKVKTQSADEQKIVLKYANLTVWVGKMWFVVGVGATLVFPFANFLTHIYYYCTSQFRWIYIYDLEFPKAINDRKDQAVIYCLLNALIITASSYGSVLYCAFCPLGPNFLLHACGQLDILTKRVEKLFYENNSVPDILNELRSIAIELQRIYNFVDDIQEVFKIVYEVILKVTSIVLPLTVYATIEAIGAGSFSIEFIIYMFGSIIISGSPCYYSELLMEKGETFRLAIYSCGWESTWDRRTRTMILLLLQRASKPIAITTIFKTMCLDTLADVYRQSYTIFNLMNAMWN